MSVVGESKASTTTYTGLVDKANIQLHHSMLIRNMTVRCYIYKNSDMQNFNLMRLKVSEP